MYVSAITQRDIAQYPVLSQNTEGGTHTHTASVVNVTYTSLVGRDFTHLFYG